MVNDKIFGAIMSLIGAVGIGLELVYLIYIPLTDESSLGGLAPGLWWGIAIPLFLGVLGVLGIVIWIGLTMIKTPPPEAWSFDETEEENTEEAS